jgi:uncharacterized protein YecE (DUF72 family)
MLGKLWVGTAGWSVPPQYQHEFPKAGSHLERYAERLPAVEINSSFYRPHRIATYERWAQSVPEHFQFAVKVPKAITHDLRLTNPSELLTKFLSEVSGLGHKLGPLLVQLPPSQAFDEVIVASFFRCLRGLFNGQVACEPRHPSWFTGEADALLAEFETARVAADPARVPLAAAQGGWPGLVYYRLHGSPEVYYSPYGPTYVEALATTLKGLVKPGRDIWCIFDNTARGEAAADALSLLHFQTAKGSVRQRGENC